MIEHETIEWAKKELNYLDPNNKYQTMLYLSALITKLLEKEQIKPIIVGGFSVEIYTDRNYTTRDLDIVVDDRDKVITILLKLGFEIDGRHLVHNHLNIAVEFPDDKLAGSYEKVTKIFIDDSDGLYAYVLSYEDIIMDRLRAYLYWGESDSKEWGKKILYRYIEDIDKNYLKTVGQGAETGEEAEEIKKWLSELEQI